MDPKVPIWIDDSSDEEQQPAKPSASASSHVPILETRMSSISVTRASAPAAEESASAPTIPPSAISHRKEPSTKLDRMMGDIHDGREARIAVGDEKHRVYNVPEPRGHLVRLRRSRAPPPPDLSQHLQVRPVQETVATGFNQQANTGNNNLADALPNSSSSKSANAPSGYSASTAINWPRSQQLAPHATPGTHLAIQSGGSVQDKPRGRSPPVSLFPPMLPSATQLTQSQANFLPPANSLPPTSHIPAIRVPTIHPPSQPSALRPQFNAAENMLFAAASRTQAMQGPTIPEINLPFAVEHSVLTTIQKLLEGALFDFAKKWAPKFLDEVVGWSAAEQGELSAWAPNLRKRPGEFMFAFKRFNNAKSPNGFLDILNRLTELRHVAVHRRAIGTYGLKRFLPDALEIASILHDVPRYLGLRAIEWAVWKPEAVGIPIQEVVAKPLEDLATMSLPPRDNYVRFVEISGLWLCPGTHKGAMPFGQPCALDYQGGPIPPPQPQLKRGRSPSPQHQPRPAARVKRVKRLKVPAQVVDLTSDDEEEKDNAPASAKTVIDLTEE